MTEENDRRVAAAREALALADAAVKRLEKLERQARQWLESSERLRQVQQLLRPREAVLDEADAILRDERRLRELQTVLPVMKSAVEHGGRTADADRSAWERALAALPADWQRAGRRAGLADYHAWIRERDQLLALATDLRVKQLQEARDAAQKLNKERAGLEKIITALPEEARRGPSQILHDLQKARDRRHDADNLLAELCTTVLEK